MCHMKLLLQQKKLKNTCFVIGSLFLFFWIIQTMECFHRCHVLDKISVSKMFSNDIFLLFHYFEVENIFAKRRVYLHIQIDFEQIWIEQNVLMTLYHVYFKDKKLLNKCYLRQKVKQKFIYMYIRAYGWFLFSVYLFFYLCFIVCSHTKNVL